MLYGEPLEPSGERQIAGRPAAYGVSAYKASGKVAITAVRMNGYFALTPVGYTAEMPVRPQIPLAVHEYASGQPRRDANGYLGVRLTLAGQRKA